MLFCWVTIHSDSKSTKENNMAQSYQRCEFISPTSGLQCEVWFPHKDREYDDKGNMLPILCDDCTLNAAAQLNGSNAVKATYIEAKNVQREFCYKFFENHSFDEGLALLDAHIAKIEAEIENQKVVRDSARAVRAEKMANLSEEERERRRKIKVEVKSKEQKTSTPSFKKDPVAKLAATIGDKEKAKDMLTMDMDELIAKYQKAKEKR